MINVDIGNTEVNFKSQAEKINKISKTETPSFATHNTPVQQLKKQLKKYNSYKNILILANGGSRTSAQGIYEALAKYKTTKNAEFVTTIEPDHLNELRKKYPKKDTLVIVITKSGTNVCPLEAMFNFWDYPILPITSDDRGVLKEICDAENKEYIIHPDIDGRFSGLTSCGIAPSILFDVDVDKIINGANQMYKKCSPKMPIEQNPALQLATALYLLEQKGYDEIFMPVYTTKLAGFLPLIIQLMHESVCKQQKGQTIFGDLAPESQHHTNQRFLGGKKNVIGLFVRIKKQEDTKTKTNIPKTLQRLELRKGTLADLDGVPLSKSLEFEYKGTYEDAISKKIPCITITIDKIDEKSIGEYIAFWQYTAMYSAMIREINPFNQPEVEMSKEISFELRKNYKR